MIMLTPAGMKKKAMLDSRKSDFSRMCSSLRMPVNRQISSRIMPMTLAGKENGRSFSITRLIQHRPMTIPICLMIFIIMYASL